MTGATQAARLARHFQTQSPGPDDRVGPILRGVLAVLLLIVTALDALLTALLGTAPLAPKARRLGRAVADEYRAAAAGAVDAEVIDDEEKPEVWR